MSTLLIGDFVGLLLFVWVLNLIRNGTLHVGYGSVFLSIIVTLICIASVPTRFAQAYERQIGSLISGRLAVFLAVYCLLLVLIYVFREVTTISRRLQTLCQQLAIELAKNSQELGSRQAPATEQRDRDVTTHDTPRKAPIAL